MGFVFGTYQDFLYFQILLIVSHAIAFLIHISVPYFVLRKYTAREMREQLIVTPLDLKYFFDLRYRNKMIRLVFITFCVHLALLMILPSSMKEFTSGIIFFHFVSSIFDVLRFRFYAQAELISGEQVSYRTVLKTYRISFFRMFIAVLIPPTLVAFEFIGSAMIYIVVCLIYLGLETIVLTQDHPFRHYRNAYKQPME